MFEPSSRRVKRRLSICIQSRRTWLHSQTAVARLMRSVVVLSLALLIQGLEEGTSALSHRQANVDLAKCKDIISLRADHQSGFHSKRCIEGYIVNTIAFRVSANDSTQHQRFYKHERRTIQARSSPAVHMRLFRAPRPFVSFL